MLFLIRRTIFMFITPRILNKIWIIPLSFPIYVLVLIIILFPNRTGVLLSGCCKYNHQDKNFRWKSPKNWRLTRALEQRKKYIRCLADHNLWGHWKILLKKNILDNAIRKSSFNNRKPKKLGSANVWLFPEKKC